MATYKVIYSPGDYQTSQDVRNVISYATSPSKTNSDGIFGGAVLPEIAAISMEGITHVFHQEDGLKLRHSVLSFSPKEPVTPRQVKEIAKDCIRYYEDDYQIIAAVHEDRDHLHIHFVMNTTSYRTGRKYRGNKTDYYGFLSHMEQATAPYGIRVKNTK